MKRQLGLCLLLALSGGIRAGAIDTRWHSPHELLPLLAQRDRIRWAMPETLSGRAWVGGDLPYEKVLDAACRQWKLSWMESNGVVVVHRADDAKLKCWSDALRTAGPDTTAAAWELGRLRDARAMVSLCEALAGKDPSIALSAAQALETLLTDIPLGREERVDPVLPGRASLAAAFLIGRSALPCQPLSASQSKLAARS